MRIIDSVAVAALSMAMAGGAFAQAPASAAGVSEAASAASAAAPISSTLRRARPAVIYPNNPGCRPEYPAVALRARAQGITRVRFTIGADGRLVSARVVQLSGTTPEHQLLDEAALAALSRCPFSAGVDESGRPIGAEITVTYQWVLDAVRPH